MKTKIFKIHGCKTSKEVLLFTQTNDDGMTEIVIQAWHETENGDTEQFETIVFPTDLMAQRYIADFSECSANEFANEFQF